MRLASSDASLRPPPSDALARDLRRGALRAAPCALLLSPVWLLGVPVGAAAWTACLWWLPLTLLESWAARGGSTPARVFGAVLLVWLAVVAGGVGVAFQVSYLEAVLAGRSPFGLTQPVRFALSWALLLGLVAMLLAVYVTIRIEEAAERTGEQGGPAALWVLVSHTCAVGLILMSVPGGWGPVLPFLVFLVCVIPFVALGAVGLLWATTNALDALEAQLWPAEPAS